MQCYRDSIDTIHDVFDLSPGLLAVSNAAAMCFNLGNSRSREAKPRTKQQVIKENSVSSLELSSLREITVRIVHAGGREELFQDVISASNVLERYPGMVVAKPGIFKHPNESVLAADDRLLPGQKYYIIPCSTVEKLKRRHSRRVARAKRAAARAKRTAEGGDEQSSGAAKAKRSGAAAESGEEPSLSVEEVTDVSAESEEDSFSSAKDYYFSREEWPELFLKRSKKKEEKKKFVPPIQMPRMWKEAGWEPSLNSIQEISP